MIKHKTSIKIVIFTALVVIASSGCDTTEKIDVDLGIYTPIGPGYRTSIEGNVTEEAIPELDFSIDLKPDNRCTLYGDNDGDGVYDDTIASGRYIVHGDNFGFVDLRMTSEKYNLKLWYYPDDPDASKEPLPQLCKMERYDDGSQLSFCYAMDR